MKDLRDQQLLLSKAKSLSKLNSLQFIVLAAVLLLVAVVEVRQELI